ncbi:MAG: hypothetical protein OXF83_07870 [Anaerolineaceae bacterium]|nr:hypothetical protein [Anaerolineaceae bacterium]
MTLLTPATLLGFLIATFWGAAFHFVLGGGYRRLFRFLLAGWLGFALGQSIGQLLENEIWVIGTLQVFPASLGAFVILFDTALRTAGHRTRVR